MEMTIVVVDGPPRVSRSDAGTVTEGSSVRVTALLSEVLTSEVAIPLTVTIEISEASD